MTTIAEEVQAVKADVRATLLDIATLIDHWATGLESGIPSSVVITVMKETAAEVRGEALKP